MYSLLCAIQLICLRLKFFLNAHATYCICVLIPHFGYIFVCFSTFHLCAYISQILFTFSRILTNFCAFWYIFHIMVHIGGFSGTLFHFTYVDTFWSGRLTSGIWGTFSWFTLYCHIFSTLWSTFVNFTNFSTNWSILWHLCNLVHFGCLWSFRSIHLERFVYFGTNWSVSSHFTQVALYRHFMVAFCTFRTFHYP